MARILQCFLSAKRLGNYVEGPDVDQYNEGKAHSDFAKPDQDIHIQGSIAWGKPGVNEDQGFMLGDIDVVFPCGKITLLVGSSGSGKSLMLASLLGEAFVLAGSITHCGSAIRPLQVGPDCWQRLKGTAYAPQVPWLQNMSIR